MLNADLAGGTVQQGNEQQPTHHKINQDQSTKKGLLHWLSGCEVEIYEIATYLQGAPSVFRGKEDFMKVVRIYYKATFFVGPAGLFSWTSEPNMWRGGGVNPEGWYPKQPSLVEGNDEDPKTCGFYSLGLSL